MNTQINISGKTVEIELSKAANNAILQRSTPLLAEMELYFSCLVRKKVRFYESDHAENAGRIQVSDNLNVSFRPVATQSCAIGDVADNEPPPVTDFEIANPRAFVPRWLQIDYKNGEWVGEFGYKR